MPNGLGPELDYPQALAKQFNNYEALPLQVNFPREIRFNINSFVSIDIDISLNSVRNWHSNQSNAEINLVEFESLDIECLH